MREYAVAMTKLPADLLPGDLIRVEGRKRPLEVLLALDGVKSGHIEVAAWGRSGVALRLPADVPVEVVA